MSSHQIRASARRVKLYRDQLIDNALIIDDSQDDFLNILNLIFDNARDAKIPKEIQSQEKTSQESPKENRENNGESKAEEANQASCPNQSFETAGSVSLKKEYRRLYREIIKKVHPDRYDILGIESEYQVKRSKKIFQNAKSCAESNNEQGIVELCAQLEVDFQNIDEDMVLPFLKDSEVQITERIKIQEKSLQMLWYHNKDSLDSKTKILKAYIEQSGKRGKNITDTLIKDVVASYNSDGSKKKRRVGQRPARLKR